ncbi:MAG: MBL fold metallo-hydrolase [Alphaproteobacteria bacterium]|nr:MBL fold metallo-hydrolase [Alphaproteobacteria bacterium]
MKSTVLFSSLALLCAAGSAGLAAPQRGPGLQMISIDVEGSGGTLFITPEGKSLLLDTGNPPRPGVVGKDTADVLADTIRSFGVKKLDYLLTTHYHSDHVGGFPAFLEKMPVGTIVDHGENRQPDPPPGSSTPPGAGRGAGAPSGGAPARPRITTEGYYQLYLKAIGNHKHLIAKPGMTLDIGSMKVTFVAADGQVIAKPLPGAGQPNPACNGLAGMADTGGEENARSVASIITYGKTRIAAFGDLTWDRDKDLVCPTNKVGKVDVYLMTNHGLPQSNSPALAAALQPIVVIEGNGITKGDDPARVKSFMESGRVQGFWRLHRNTQHPELDGSDDMIANPVDALPKDRHYNLRLRILKNGSVTVINERNGYNRTYKTGG